MFLMLVFVTAPFLSLTADWPRFRGPAGNGVSAAKKVPLKWSEKSGLAWKTKLPGPGSSSPIVSGGRVFVTGYTGYGLPEQDGGSLEDLKRYVACIDEDNGKLLWTREVGAKLPEERYGGIGIPHHGYASSTPVADESAVYAFFGKSGVVAFDRDGKELWKAATGPGTDRFGSAASPVLYKNLVIVSAPVETEALIAFDKKSGKEVWRAPAEGYGGWWGTPVLARAGGRDELILVVPAEIWALNPATGKLRWYTESNSRRATCTSAVVHDGVVYAVGGSRPGWSLAVRAGGRGNVTESHVVWRGDRGSYVPSPVFDGGHLYWVSDRGGIAFCARGDTGKQVYQERIPDAGGIYASPLLAAGRLYVVSRTRGTFVLPAEPKFAVLAHNEFASDDSDFNASPAVSRGRILLRSNRFLYAVGP